MRLSNEELAENRHASPGGGEAWPPPLVARRNTVIWKKDDKGPGNDIYRLYLFWLLATF